MSEEIKSHAAKLSEIAFALLGDCAKKEVHFAQRFGLTTAEFHCLRFINSGPSRLWLDCMLATKESENRLLK